MAIKFSNIYKKMPEQVTADLMTTGRSWSNLLQIVLLDRRDLTDGFLQYDTSFDGGNYPIGNGVWILIFLERGGQLWTTLRAWNPEKEKYYRGLVGQKTAIELMKSSF